MDKQEEVDEIWDNAGKIAKDQIVEAMFTSMPDDFPSMNPYAKEDWRHEEWEAAHEHYIMTGLGY